MTTRPVFRKSVRYLIRWICLIFLHCFIAFPVLQVKC